MDFLEKLAERGKIKNEDIVEIREKVTGNKDIEELLEKRGVSSSEILRAKSDIGDIPHKKIDEKIPFKTLQYIPQESAKYYEIIPIEDKDGILEVGIVDSSNMEAIDALNFISSKIGMPFKLFVISKKDFEKVLKMYEGFSGQVSEALSVLDEESQDKKKEIENLENQMAEDVETKEEAPITKIVATVLRYAVEGGASDVHIELTNEKLRVRFRVDGVLNTSLVLPQKVHENVVSRIKVLSSMRLDVKRRPQDGRFSAIFEKREIDFRVSTFPAYYGEKVVMRILDKQKGVKSLEKTGLYDNSLEKVRKAIKKPHGIFLISGPTGSGKSTTLYSILKEMDRESENVVSLEDPVEYNIKGVSQAEMRPEIGFTFASGLRTTLRQDPDVIMVGEIRDKETAELAMRAALTGHLVLSTIHTNSAIGVIPRLIDMGIDPYLIAPSLIASVAQRLVRKMCSGTGEKIPVEGSVKMMLEEQFADLPEKYKQELLNFDYIYKKQATPECPVGVRGRIGVFEIMEMNQQIEDALLNNPTEKEFKKAARENGMITMKEDAIIKCSKGIVPFEEVNNLWG